MDQPMTTLLLFCGVTYGRGPMVQKRGGRPDRLGGSRRGISLMEVVFAMGVLLVGLGGLAAVLGVAGDTAKETIEGNLALAVTANQNAVREIEGSGAAFIETYLQPANDESQVSATNPRFVPRNMLAPTERQDVFIVDPWFITAADTLRPQTGGRNGYDRSLFPCYDDRLDIVNHGPQEDIEQSPAGWSPQMPEATFNPLTPANEDTFEPVRPPWSATFAGPTATYANPNYPLGRRLPRLVPGDSVNPRLIADRATRSDRLQVVFDPNRERREVGLAVLRPGTTTDAITLRQRDTRSFITLVERVGSDTRTVSVIFDNREVVINPTGVFDGNPSGTELPLHNLSPFTASADPTDPNIAVANQNYRGERLGYVTFAESIMDNGTGTFTMRSHRSVDPRVEEGDYLMLLRRNYLFDLTAPMLATNGDAVPRRPGRLLFAFARVEKVDIEPTLVDMNTAFETTVTVSGPDWVFHPAQTYVRNLQGRNPYLARAYPGSGYNFATPAGVILNPDGTNLGTYDASSVNGDRNVNHGGTGVAGDPLYGTVVVMMDNVISVTAQ